MRTGSTVANPAEIARHQAQQILRGPTYSQTTHQPRPFAGILHDIGHALEKVFDPIGHWLSGDVFDPIHVALGDWWPLAIVIPGLLVGGFISLLIIRRRGKVRTRVAGGTDSDVEGSDRSVEPRTLDAAAKRAEREGDYKGAVCLRFRAGLIRLERSGLIVDGEVRTSTALSSALQSPTFTALSGEHELIVYGGRTATEHDAIHARESWPRVSGEAKTPVESGAR